MRDKCPNSGGSKICESSKICEFLKIDYDHSVVGKSGDVLIVYFTTGRFWLCDKDYGIQDAGDYWRVTRVFGAGRSGR